jgi:trehalose 6-phosphate phosphatase
MSNPSPLSIDRLLVPAWEQHSYWIFDLDGTLLDFAPQPDAVEVPSSLLSDLAELSRRVEHRVAVISGRALQDLERFIPLSSLQLAGNHGAEWRVDGHYGQVSFPAAVKDTWAVARQQCQHLVASVPGVMLEDKGFTCTLHVRQLDRAAREKVKEELARVTSSLPGIALRPAAHAWELYPTFCPNKGTMVRKLLSPMPPTVRPYVFGDDWTDEDSFLAAPHGITVVVGNRRPTAARYALPHPAALRSLLHEVARHHRLSKD